MSENLAGALIKFLQKKEEEHQKVRTLRQGPYFTASDAGLCIAKSFHRFKGTDEEGIKSEGLLVVELGNVLHKIIQDAFKGYKETVSEGFLIDKDLRLAGSLDIYLIEDCKLIEVKTVHDWKFKTMFGRKSEKEPVDHNKLQLGTYAHLLEINGYTVKSMELWYINRNDGRIKQCEIEMIWRDYAVNYWENMQDEISHGNKEGFADHFMVPMYNWECNYCGFANNCEWKKEKGKR
ncbi:MAG: PD-(D/E)XK nuclease family protein [Candidatus Brocadiales bacterium]|nr:PD-(D/E)XK nuclease family protein [Candidatus Brocadiales bacterium]